MKEIELPEQKKKHNYIFPDFFGKIMGSTSLKFQYESAMMSLVFLIIGLIATSIYYIFFSSSGAFTKWMIGINCFFGITFLYSNLITVFQQYQSYCQIENVQEIFSKAIDDVNTELKGGNAQNG